MIIRIERTLGLYRNLIKLDGRHTHELLPLLNRLFIAHTQARLRYSVTNNELISPADSSCGHVYLLDMRFEYFNRLPIWSSRIRGRPALIELIFQFGSWHYFQVWNHCWELSFNWLESFKAVVKICLKDTVLLGRFGSALMGGISSSVF